MNKYHQNTLHFPTYESNVSSQGKRDAAYMAKGIIITMHEGKICLLKSDIALEDAPAFIEEYERENDTPCSFFETDEQSAEMVLSVVNESQSLDRMLDAE